MRQIYIPNTRTSIVFFHLLSKGAYLTTWMTEKTYTHYNSRPPAVIQTGWYSNMIGKITREYSIYFAYNHNETYRLIFRLFRDVIEIYFTSTSPPFYINLLKTRRKINNEVKNFYLSTARDCHSIELQLFSSFNSATVLRQHSWLEFYRTVFLNAHITDVYKDNSFGLSRFAFCIAVPVKLEVGYQRGVGP